MSRLLVAIVAALVLAGASSAASARRVALVVGNAAYKTAQPLANPANDAREISTALERLGFTVTTAIDATQDQILTALDTFANELPGAEAALFYYSGHGMQIDGTNYLLPVDIEVESERSLRYGAIDVAEIVADMERNVEVAIVILDACRDNPFLAKLQKAGTRSVAASRGLALIRSIGNGTIIAYAAEPGAVASDGEGGHSPYTAALLAEIEEPNVEVGLVFRRVAGAVVEETDGRQHPELLVRLTREFYLKTEEVKVAGGTPEPAVAVAESATMPPAPVTPPEVSVAVVQPKAEVAPDRTSSPPAVATRPYAELVDRLDLAAAAYSPAPVWQPAEWTALTEAEPNNSGGTANPVVLKSRLTFSVDPIGDGDWFYFTVDGAGELRIAAPSSPPEIDLAARLLNADGGVVMDWKGAPRPGGALEVSADLPRPGAYWLELRDNYNDAASPGNAEVSLDFIPAEDGYEPNDQPSKARTILPNGAYRANILPLGDGDWFRLAVDWPGELSVKIPDAPAALDVAVKLYDADLNVVGDWVVPPRPGGVTDARFDLKKPGYYLLEVRDSYNDARAAEAFTIETKFTQSPDVYEPDDVLAEAVTIPPTGERRVTMFPRGEGDFFRVDIDQPGEFSVDASEVPPELDIAFRVFDADQRAVIDWVAAPRPGGDTSAFGDIARAGAYFIELRDGSNDSSSVAPFLFRTHFTPAPDQYEPNDSAGAATIIRPGGEIAFNILPRNDGDWFKFTVEEPGELALAIDHGPQNLDIHFRVLNADYQPVLDWVPPYAKGGLTEGIADLSTAGTYFIEVRDGANDDRSIENATLATVFTPTVGSYEPNDTFGSATPVALSGETYAHILPRGDGDWHLVYAPSPGKLELWAEDVPENLDVSLRVVDADQRDLTGWIVPPRPGGVTNGAVELPAAGWYRIEIRDGGNDQRSPQPFRLRRAFTPAG